MLFDDENYLFYHGQLSFYCKMLAQCHARMGNRERMLQALRQAVYSAKQADALPSGEIHYTATFVRYAVHDTAKTTKNFTQTHVEILMEDLQTYDIFAPYREDADFQALLL